MDEETVNDLRAIYGNSLPDDLLGRFIQALRKWWDGHQRVVDISTRGNSGDIVSFDDIQYFRIWHRRICNRRVVFAGGVEPSPRNGRQPVVRFIDTNRFLQDVPEVQRFPFTRPRNPGWTCVMITPQNVQLFNNLADEQLQWFESRYGRLE